MPAYLNIRAGQASQLTAKCLSTEVSTTSSLRLDAEKVKNRPGSKVTTLLKDMLKQLEKEAEEDEEIYDKMACWCETNDKGLLVRDE